MTILDIIISAAAFIFVGRLLWFKFKSKPSDKYHNDSWPNRNK
ncbi:hypothetical protein [Flavobacterium sp.]|nr:hypothetical protein [Flavobacterium sp.]